MSDANTLTELELTAQKLVADVLSGFRYGGESVNTLLAEAPVIIESESGLEVSASFVVPNDTFAESLAEALHVAFSESGGADLDSVVIDSAIPAVATMNFSTQVAGVKNIVAVASGKGGVGKSTTAVNLALALAKQGANVGLLDADIYGPSVPAMLGVDGQRPEVKEGNRIQPLRTQGLQLISMGNLVNEKTPMVWRGPMVSGALLQLLMNTDWDDVDYLIIDMPPGTGDIPLTLSQKVPVSGSVIVTTPQDIALLDAKKGVEMFAKVSIPVFGIVENMAVHICGNCGHEEHIFGERGGEDLAEQYGVPVLTSLPLAMKIRQQMDAGVPPVADEPDSEFSQRYKMLAEKVAVAVAKTAEQTVPEISIS